MPQERKPCDWPPCERTVVVTRAFCQDRKCQVARFHARKGFVESTDEEAAAINAHWEKRQAMYRRHQKTQQIRMRVYRRALTVRFSQVERAMFLANSQYRLEQQAAIMAEASGELRELIEAQIADKGWTVSRKGDPWGMLSLDAVIPGTDTTWGDLLSVDDLAS